MHTTLIGLLVIRIIIVIAIIFTITMAIIIRTIIKPTLLIVIVVLVLCLLLFLLSLVAALLIDWLWVLQLLDTHIVFIVAVICMFITPLPITSIYKYLDIPAIYSAYI